MEYPLDELLDKRSIILLKIERIHDDSLKERLWKEFSDYTVAIWNYIGKGACTIQQIEEWHKELYKANATTWDLETEIRKGKEGQIGLEEVGKRSIEIRDSNGIRVAIKSKVVQITGIGYRDIKENHASIEAYKEYERNLKLEKQSN